MADLNGYLNLYKKYDLLVNNNEIIKNEKVRYQHFIIDSFIILTSKTNS